MRRGVGRLPLGLRAHARAAVIGAYVSDALRWTFARSGRSARPGPAAADRLDPPRLQPPKDAPPEPLAPVWPPRRLPWQPPRPQSSREASCLHLAVAIRVGAAGQDAEKECYEGRPCAEKHVLKDKKKLCKSCWASCAIACSEDLRRTRSEGWGHARTDMDMHPGESCKAYLVCLMERTMVLSHKIAAGILKSSPEQREAMTKALGGWHSDPAELAKDPTYVLDHRSIIVTDAEAQFINRIVGGFDQCQSQALGVRLRFPRLRLDPRHGAGRGRTLLPPDLRLAILPLAQPCRPLPRQQPRPPVQLPVGRAGLSRSTRWALSALTTPWSSRLSGLTWPLRPSRTSPRKPQLREGAGGDAAAH